MTRQAQSYASRADALAATGRRGATLAAALSIDEAIDGYRLYLRSGNLSDVTVNLYVAELQKLERFLLNHGMPTDVGGLRREHI